MAPVLQILTITFPFFALVLCGYIAAHRGMLPLRAIPGMNAFVLFFALPCMLYPLLVWAPAESPVTSALRLPASTEHQLASCYP